MSNLQYVYVLGTNTEGYLLREDYETETLLLRTRDGEIVKESSDNGYEILEKVPNTYGEPIFEGDVFEVNGTKVEVSSEGIFALEYDSLERLAETNLLNTNENAKLLKNIYVLLHEKAEKESREEELRNFNIKILRGNNSEGEITYYYACNDLARGQVDIITVSFIGATLPNTPYERDEISYKELAHLLESNLVTEVHPDELALYALGIKSFAKENETDDEKNTRFCHECQQDVEKPCTPYCDIECSWCEGDLSKCNCKFNPWK